MRKGLRDSLSALLLALTTPLIACATAPVAGGMGKELSPGLHQMDGTDLVAGQVTHVFPEVPDPSPPFVTRDGKVEIYGSAYVYLRYPSWAEFERGGRYEVMPLELRYSSGAKYEGEYTQPWDLRKYRVLKPDGSEEEILVGGSMSPTQGRPVAVWPEDNINRRIYVFRRKGDAWVRDEQPVSGDPLTGWLGHSYGGNFFQPQEEDPGVLRVDAKGKPQAPTFFFYEQVSTPASPERTEIYMKPIPSLEVFSSAGESLILRIPDPPFPSTRRTIGGVLIEGPRPARMNIQGKDFFIVGFSSGDFPTDFYTMNYAWASSLNGPWHYALDPVSKDLLDLGREIKAAYGLSWVGRPSFFRSPDGTYEVMFHGVSKAILPDNDYTVWPKKYALWQFFRSIFKARIEATLDPAGAPRLRIAAPKR
jgi:hypothetical protein